MTLDLTPALGPVVREFALRVHEHGCSMHKSGRDDLGVTLAGDFDVSELLADGALFLLRPDTPLSDVPRDVRASPHDAMERARGGCVVLAFPAVREIAPLRVVGGGCGGLPCDCEAME